MDKDCNRCGIKFIPTQRKARYCNDCRFFRLYRREPVTTGDITTRILRQLNKKTTKGRKGGCVGRVKDVVRKPYNIKKNDSLKRGKSFDLTLEEYREWYIKLRNNTCGYCKKTFAKLTLDRKNNNLGYVKGNLVVACRSCNSAKGIMSSWMFKRRLLTQLSNEIHILPKTRQNNEPFV